MSADDQPTPPTDDSDEAPRTPTRTSPQDLPDGVRPAVSDDLDDPVAETPPSEAERRERDPVATPLPPDAADPLDPRPDDETIPESAPGRTDPGSTSAGSTSGDR